jgi:hypothetical protein
VENSPVTPFSAKASWFYQLAVMIPAPQAKRMIVEAASDQVGILSITQATQIIAALRLQGV